ncbi:MAG TPA: 30S ribosomal protein S5 [Candidatus Paceibacterota bacterium]|nr:30S ribosomal protein S5 [Candidatus Paceibacterota bacterium]
MNDIAPEKVSEAPVEAAPTAAQPAAEASRAPRGAMRDRRGPRRGGPRREERVKPEFDQKILTMRRVTRVVAGGRRFSFSVALVAGNRKGMVGVGLGKAGDTALAIEKAFRDAKKNMVTLPLTKTGSIPHDVETKYASARVLLMPAPGRGLVAGGAVRAVLEFAGAKDVAGKILSRSKNDLNNARAAVRALSSLRLRRAR